MSDAWQFSAHIGNLFTELPFVERFAAAARCGFIAIEFPEPYAIPARDIVRCLGDHGLAYAQLGVIGDTAKGDKGLAALAGRAPEFRERLRQSLDYAGEVKAHFVHVLAGILPPAADRDAAWSLYLDNLAYAAEAAAAAGQRLIIEAMSPRGAPGYFLDDPQLALKAIRRTAMPNLGLMVDVFHSVNAGVDPAQLIREAGAGVVHVHLADHPGRHEPGTGAVDFTTIARALLDIGYAGLLGCEYVPLDTTEAGLAWMNDATRWPMRRTE